VPAGGKQNTYARQQRRRRRPPPPMVPHGPGGQMLRPAPRHPYIPPSARARNRPRAGGRLFHPAPALPSRPRPSARQRAKAQERSYRSQGQAVERTANRQRRAAQQRVVRRRALAQERAYRSLGQAIERAANRANVQTRMAHLRPGPSLHDVGQFLSRPAGFFGASGTRHSTGRAGGGSFASAQLFSPMEARKIGGDIQALGTGPFVAGYQLGAGTYEAATGHGTRRLQRLGKGVVEGTLHSAPGELLTGHPGKALKVAQQHPLISALDVAAAAGVVGRVAGAGARLASGHRLGSTVRPPVAQSLDAGAVKAGAYVEREGSHDLLRRAVQRAADARREPVRDAQGNVVRVKQRGRSVPVLKPTAGELKRGARREGDFRAGRANALERLRRELVAREMRTKGVRGQRAKDLVAMVVEGTVRSRKTFEADLRSHLARLEREHGQRMRSDPKGFRQSGEAAMNEHRQALVRDVLASPRVMRQAPKIVAHGERIGRRLNELEQAALKRGVLTDEQMARRSGLVPAAIEHLGARHFTEREHAKLEAAARRVEESLPEGSAARAAARERRIAVSGRDPGGVKAHEAARATAEKARGEEKAARARIARLEAARQRLIGAQSSRRGRRMAEGRSGATTAERSKLAKIDGEIKQARKAAHDAGQLARKAEHTSRRAPMPEIKAAIRHGEDSAAETGTHLPNDAIEQALRDSGRDPASVAYLPHVPPGDRAFHTQFRPGTRPTLDKAGAKGRRTGEAYRKGATSATADLLTQQGVRLTTQVSKAEQLDALVGERGLRHPDWKAVEEKAARGDRLDKRERRLLDGHGYMTGREADEYADRIVWDTGTNRNVLVSPNGERLVAMRAFPARLSKHTQQIIAQDLQGPAGMESLSQRLLNERVIDPSELKGQPSRNVVLVNADLVKRLEDHLKPAGEIERFLQMLNRPFRFAVLAQPRWLVGNFVEPYLVRLPTAGTGAVNVFGLGNDIRIASKVLKAARASKDPRVRQVADELEAQHLGGLFIGGRGASNRRMFEDSEVYGKMVAKVPATRHMYELSHKLGQVLIAPGRAYFWANRQGIERWAQKASLGRSARRDMVEFFGSWQKAARFGEEAAQEAAKGLVNTPTQLRFLHEQQRLLGQYGDFSPRLRRAVQGPMPFLPWALSAARFVYWTMPVHHTILTAALLKTEAVVHKDWEQQHAFLKPEMRQGTLGMDPVRKDGGITPLARYTPYGLTGPAIHGDLEGLDQALPALGGPTKALFSGQDPFGRPLTTEKTASNPQGTVNGLVPKAAVAGNELAEALVPYLSQIRRLREHGETALSTSTALSPKTKPDSSHGMSAARRTFDPFRPTYVRAGGSGKVKALSGKAAKDLGLDAADMHDLQQAARDAGAGLDKADLEELRQLARGGG
jgi:hypothetical protein